MCAREQTLQGYLTDNGRAVRDNARNVSAVYVLLDTLKEKKIVGYYTASNCVIVPSELPLDMRKKLNRYESWGAVKLGRMARDDSYADYGVGPILLSYAFRTAIEVQKLSGSIGLVVDAKNERLVRWYAEHGVVALIDHPSTLFIMNATMTDFLTKIDVALGVTEPEALDTSS
jgi:hypothetical protein